MSRSAARGGALALVVASLLIGTPASAVTSHVPARAQFDSDDFSMSGSTGTADGSVSWSRSGGRVIHGRVTGTLQSRGDNCARLEVVWLNSANSTLSRNSSRTCDSTGFGLSYSSPNLQCVLIRLGGSTRQLCAGGS